jgi:hypothetical protein
MKLVIIAIVGLVLLFILFRLFKTFVKWTFILLVALFAVAFFTNPNESAIRDDLKKTTKERRLKKIRDKSVQVTNYKLFSLVKVERGDLPQTVGVAALGKVWYFDNLEPKGGN